MMTSFNNLMENIKMTLTDQQIKHFQSLGYLIVPQVFEASEIVALRDAFEDIVSLAMQDDLSPEYLKGIAGGVHIHIQSPPDVTGLSRAQYLRKAQWPALIHPTFERIRNSPKFVQLLEPLLGTSLKQFINQINFKMPGGNIDFPWHQDIRPTPAFRDQVNNYVQTIIAVDDATEENGCLWIVPKSHTLGNLKVKRYASGQIEDHIDVSKAVPCLAKAGDVILFTSYTVHGSQPNQTDQPRRSYINGFVRSNMCDVGKWAFLEGTPVPITSDRDYADIRLTI
jgi:ectoine hydroxylase-related dioxygenase (phytanoyl-CoA dioxygenase family)